MKIAVVGPVHPYRGGIAHHTTMLTNALSKNHSVRVISFRRQFPKWLYPGSSDQDPSRNYQKVKAEMILDPLNPLTWIKATNKLATWRPDQVIFQWWTTFWAPAFFAISIILRWRGIQSTFIVHNVLPHEERWWDKYLALMTLSKANYCIVHSENEKTRLNDLIPIVEVRYVPHPKYTIFAENRIPKNEARQKLNLPDSMPILLFFGIVRGYKGLNILLEAVAKLRDMGRPTFLLVGGEIWDKKTNYDKQVTDLNISKLVKIENRYIPNEQVPMFFSAADVLILPYLSGTQSGVATIGLCFGLPIIATEYVASGISKQDQEHLIKVPPGDVNSLVTVIDQFISSNRFGKTESDMSKTNDWIEMVKVLENLSPKI